MKKFYSEQTVKRNLLQDVGRIVCNSPWLFLCKAGKSYETYQQGKDILSRKTGKLMPLAEENDILFYNIRWLILK